MSEPTSAPPVLRSLRLTRLALYSAVLLSSSSASRLNQTLAKLPQTSEYSRPLTSYSVDQVVSVAKPCYPKVERTPAQIFVFDGAKLDYPSTFKVNRNGQSTTTRSDYAKVISLDHDGIRLTGGTSNMETW